MPPPVRANTCEHCSAWQPTTYTTGECHDAPLSLVDQAWPILRDVDWCLRYKTGQAPMLQSITPNTFASGAAVTCSVKGKYFTAQSVLDTSAGPPGVPITTTYVDVNTLTVTAPIGANKGTYQMRVYNQDGRVSNPVNLTIK